MHYSDWQLKRIRDALRAFHSHTRLRDGTSCTWNYLALEISDYGGLGFSDKQIKLFSERIRQFVEGILKEGGKKKKAKKKKPRKQEGSRRYPKLQDAWFEAILSFITHEDVNLLSENELDEYTPSYQAPVRLLEYLDQAFDTERLVPPDTLSGTYQACRTDDDGFTFIELTMQLPSEDGLIQVIETEDSYDAKAADAFSGWTYQERRVNRNSQIKHGGWAILTPEDNLFVFLKDESNGANRYYFTLASDGFIWSNSPSGRLYLLHHDYPLEPGAFDIPKEQDRIVTEISNAFAKNIRAFKKVE